MSQIRDTSSNAAARAVGRELLDAALQSNPLIGPAATLLGSLVGLFRRRSQAEPSPGPELKPEEHSRQPAASLGGLDPKGGPHAPKGDTNAERDQNEGSTKTGILRGRHRFPSPRLSAAGRAEKGGRRRG